MNETDAEKVIDNKLAETYNYICIFAFGNRKYTVSSNIKILFAFGVI